MAELYALMTSARTGEPDKDEWMTPLWLFEMLDGEFHFDLDPAANYENALCDAWYSKDPQEAGDGLTNEWFGNVFVNPPYSKMRQWVEKGYREAHFNGKVNLVVMLIAARTDTRAWWNYIRYGEVRFIRGRLKFDLPQAEILKAEIRNIERVAQGKKPLSLNNSAPFPSAVVVFRKGMLKEKTVYWEIEKGKNA